MRPELSSAPLNVRRFSATKMNVNGCSADGRRFKLDPVTTNEGVQSRGCSLTSSCVSGTKLRREGHGCLNPLVQILRTRSMDPPLWSGYAPTLCHNGRSRFQTSGIHTSGIPAAGCSDYALTQAPLSGVDRADLVGDSGLLRTSYRLPRRT